MEIEIPSPSVFLQPSPLASANAATTRKRRPEVQSSATTKVTTKPNAIATVATNEKGAVSRRKQSKSRNGCATCKRKRLKCDETKPGCAQCEKRNVECEGYTKNYRWKSFEDTTSRSKEGKSAKTQDTSTKSRPQTHQLTRPAARSVTSSSDEDEGQNMPSSSSSSQQHVFMSVMPVISRPAPQPQASPSGSFHETLNPLESVLVPNLNQHADQAGLHVPLPSPSTSPSPLPSPGLSNRRPRSRASENASNHSATSRASPEVVELALTGSNPGQPPESLDLWLSASPPSYMAKLHGDSFFPETLIGGEGDHEEVMNQCRGDYMTDAFDPQRGFQPLSPAASEALSNFSRSSDISMGRVPPLDPSSAEMLMLRFDRETCGILSIKDGPDENPWRTLVWPLAKDSPALCHAVLAMAALHGGASMPQLRLTGMAHMTKSISKLSTDMHQMSLDQNLATALALALAEGWDEKISTGIQHLKGARTLLKKRLAQGSHGLQSGTADHDSARRLKFLANTYVYLDAIARLTSGEDQDTIDLEKLLQTMNEPFEDTLIEVDPLMGCATALFPLLGRVGHLIQRMRRTHTNSLGMVSEANELREQLLHWEPPDIACVEEPADPSSNVRHIIQTAEAYRRAILLHLHHASTELASEPSYDQAKELLALLAATPLSSRTLIVQIFPLLVGSCEMVTEEDRQWVADRWEAMSQRLNLVNVTSCWDVVQEVWQRRDRHVEQQRQRTSRVAGRDPPPHASVGVRFHENVRDINSREHHLNKGGPMSDSRTGSPFDPARKRQWVKLPRRHTDVSLLTGEREFTVRGRLHWLGVMSDWKWEVFLG